MRQNEAACCGSIPCADNGAMLDEASRGRQTIFIEYRLQCGTQSKWSGPFMTLRRLLVYTRLVAVYAAED